MPLFRRSQSRAVERQMKAVQSYYDSLPEPGEDPTAEYKARARNYADSLRSQADEVANRLVEGSDARDGERHVWVADGKTIYIEVAYRIPTDNHWPSSIEPLADSIVAKAGRRYPQNDEKAGALAAYLAMCAREALVFMLPISGGEAATRLLVRVGEGPPASAEDEWSPY